MSSRRINIRVDDRMKSVAVQHCGPEGEKKGKQYPTAGSTEQSTTHKEVTRGQHILRLNIKHQACGYKQNESGIVP